MNTSSHDGSGEPVVRLRGVERSFGETGHRVEVLRGIDLDLLEGDFVAICGASGSGKSTLLQIIGCLDRPTAGEHIWRGRRLEEFSDAELARIRNEEIGFVFQSFNLLPDRTALENVRLPLDYRRGGEVPHEPRQVLEWVGLGNRLDHRPGQLSGGERQRVAIARALVKKPRLILCDEPTGNLDTRTGTEILDLLDRFHGEGRGTLLLVTHDERVADRAHHVLELSDGQWATA